MLFVKKKIILYLIIILFQVDNNKILSKLLIQYQTFEKTIAIILYKNYFYILYLCINITYKVLSYSCFMSSLTVLKPTLLL